MNGKLDELVNALGNAPELAGKKLQIHRTRKNNGVERTGILIAGEDGAGTIFYVDDYLRDLENGSETIDDVVSYILSNGGKIITSKSQIGASLNVDINSLLEKDVLLGRVRRVIVNTEKNKDILENIPHRNFLDLTIMYRIFIGSNYHASVLISNEIMENAGLTLEELDLAAAINGAVRNRAQSLIDIIKEAMGEIANGLEDYEETKMIVLTNAERFYGASVIVDRAFLRDVSKSFGGDFYIIPSSVHECIAISMNEYYGPENIRDIIGCVNTEQVSDDEVLSGHVYRYIAEADSVIIAA